MVVVVMAAAAMTTARVMLFWCRMSLWLDGDWCRGITRVPLGEKVVICTPNALPALHERHWIKMW